MAFENICLFSPRSGKVSAVSKQAFEIFTGFGVFFFSFFLSLFCFVLMFSCYVRIWKYILYGVKARAHTQKMYSQGYEVHV